MNAMPSLPSYPTDLKDLEWAIVEEVFGGPSKIGRPPRFDRRAVLGAIFYMVRTGGSRRLLPARSAAVAHRLLVLRTLAGRGAL